MKSPRTLTHLGLLPLLVGLAGCIYHGSLYAERPKNKAVDHAIDRMWTEEVRKVARDGDWILSRSLSPEGDMIATLVGGEQFSHASIVDVTHGTLIEATLPKVQEISLEEFMARNWYVVVVRPTGLTADEQRQALELARSQVGTDFDVWGFVGYPEPDKWYCTELVYWASGMEQRHGGYVVLLPRQMLRYGQVVYYSGRRDDAQVQAIADARVNVDHDATVANATDPGDEDELEIDP